MTVRSRRSRVWAQARDPAPHTGGGAGGVCAAPQPTGYTSGFPDSRFNRFSGSDDTASLAFESTLKNKTDFLP